MPTIETLAAQLARDVRAEGGELATEQVLAHSGTLRKLVTAALSYAEDRGMLISRTEEASVGCGQCGSRVVRTFWKARV
jgi:hypothetical protein